MNKNIVTRSFSFVLMAVGVIFLYLLAHEGGHAVAAIILGGKVTNFDINLITGWPHVSYNGIITAWAHALVLAAGPLFPVLLALLTLPFGKKSSPEIKQFKSMFYLCSIASLAAQAVLSLLHLGGIDLPAEDVVKFIRYTGAHPLFVSFITLCLLGLSLWLGSKHSTFRDALMSPLQELRQKSMGRRERLVTLAAALIPILLILPFMFRIINVPSLSKPTNYDLKLSMSFKEFSGQSTTVHEFSLDKPQMLDIVFSMHIGKPTTVRIVTDNPAGFLMNGRPTMTMHEGWGNVSQAYFTGMPLEAGQYRVEVETDDRSGKIDMYVTLKNPTPDQLYFYSLLKDLGEGNFDANSYSEPGYKLVYEGPLDGTSDTVIHTLNSGGQPIAVSAFVVGPFEEVSLKYQGRNQTMPLLTNSRFTTGFRFPPASGQGELKLSSTEANGKIYVYVNTSP